MIIKIYKIKINGVNVANFDMINKNQVIEHINALNIDIKSLQEMNIKLIGWKNISKAS